MIERHPIPAAPVLSLVEGAMSPGKYIGMRRESAGLDLVDVALAIAAPHLTAEEAGFLIARLEGDELVFERASEHVALIEALEQVFRFDPEVYWKLGAARTDPLTVLPQICRECGCSWMDPCVEHGGVACGWANAGSGEAPLCTLCNASLLADAEADAAREQELAARALEGAPRAA